MRVPNEGEGMERHFFNASKVFGAWNRSTKKVDQLEAEKTVIFPIWESPTAMFPVCFSTSPSTVAVCQVVAATRDMEKRLGSLRQALVFWRTSVCQKRGCDGWVGVDRIPCQRYSMIFPNAVS